LRLVFGRSAACLRSLVTVLRVHAEHAETAERCLGALHNLAASAENQLPIAAVPGYLPAVLAALRHHEGVSFVAERGLGLLSYLSMQGAKWRACSLCAPCCLATEHVYS